MLSVPPPSGPTREVRLEQWERRTFYAAACRFFIDVPLDMSGIVNGAQREAQGAGFAIKAGVPAYATDSIYRGAVLLELEKDPGFDGNHIVRIHGEVLVRALPQKGVKLRAELGELVRWAKDIGYEVDASFIAYEMSGSLPAGNMKPTQVFATVKSAE